MVSFITWNVSPEIFTIPEIAGFGPFPIRWYGLLFALGFFLGQQIMIHIFKKENKPLADIDALTLYMLISTVIGARIGHFLFYEPQVFFVNPLEVLMPPYAGLASHGAAVGIITGLYLYARTRKSTGQTFFWVADRIVITVALGGAFIRFGNLMNSEIVGKFSEMPWAFLFLRNTEYLPIVPRHPAQLYESIACLVLFIFLFRLWSVKKEKLQPGMMVGIFLVWVFTLRFLFEFVKENQVDFENGMALNMGQILSIPVVLLGLYFIWQSRRLNKAA